MPLTKCDPERDFAAEVGRTVSPELFKALSIAERLECRRQNPAESSVDAARAERRWNQWRSQPPFDIGDYLERRAQADGLTIGEFQSLLGLSAGDLSFAHSTPPHWMQKVGQALTEFSDQTEDSDLPTLPGNEAAMSLLSPVRCFLRQAWERLLSGLAPVRQIHSELEFDSNRLASIWLVAGYPRILDMICRTLVLELHIANADGQLDGSTAEERFRSFCDELAEPHVTRRLFHEYPVLARQVVLAIEQWVDVGLEFIHRLSQDYGVVCETFASNAPPGRLVDIETSAGDGHRGGRRVLIAEFESGLKVVYKPRSLAVDVRFQELVEWFNDHGDHLPLRVLRLLDCNTYGWCEFVSAKPCQSELEVHRFYQRQGVYTALLYVLQATDFHSENLIAAGEHPVLVDLESLLTPMQDAFEGMHAADRAFAETFARSILRSGLPPHGIWSYGDEDGIDISGLGTVAGQVTPHRVPYFEGIGTDRMRLKRERKEMRPANNRPTLAGRDIDLLEYHSDLIVGFRSAYQTLVRHRDELLSEQGPLASFSNVEIRPILRLTQNYAILLEESFHPDLLRDGLDRDRFFDRLWIETTRNPSLSRIITAETADLQNTDIPIFTTFPNSTHVWSSQGERIDDFFPQSGLAAAMKCIEGLGPKNLERQLWLLHAALATTVVRPVNIDLPAASRHEPVPPRRCEEFLNAARTIADRMGQMAIREGDEVNWLGLILVGQRRTGIRPLQNDLYDGLAGIGLFLAYLGDMTADKHYTELAESSLRTMRRYAAGSGALQGSIGGFDGWGGYVYALTHLGTLWNRSELFAEADHVAERLPDLIRTSRIDGVLGGTAGCLASLLVLHRSTGSQRALEAAQLCGDCIVQAARRQPVGLGWMMEQSKTKTPLTGFAHGTAGIAWALFDLWLVIGEARFRDVARQAVEYERSLFSPTQGNWPDLRSQESAATREGQPGNFMVAWCHGAAGIGLGRLLLQQHSPDDQTGAEIEAALRTTWRQGFGGNHSLCHGDLGNLELLLQASQVLQHRSLDSQVRLLADTILNDIQTNGPRCGVALNVEHPGLMTGLAGIGYELLRLSAPHRVPSIVTLDGPPAR